jgi:phosphohistidine swiveling domain-containing protein
LLYFKYENSKNTNKDYCLIQKSPYFYVSVIVLSALNSEIVQYCFAKNTIQSQLACYDNTVAEKEVVTGMIFGSHKLTTGTARIVKSHADLKKVKSGDIIVTVMTQEAWLPSLQKSAGIITNLGDSVCHAALYGKKNAIPVLVGARNATEKITDGHLIIMDCSQGIVGRVYLSEDNTMLQGMYTSVGHSDAPHYNSSTFHMGQQHFSDMSHNAFSSHDQRTGPKRICVTADMLKKHFQPFLSYVIKMQEELNYGRSWGEFFVFKGAKYKGKCDDFAIECIPLIYDFFDQDKNYIESILKLIVSDSYLHYINALFEQSTLKPGDMNWIARVSHTEHVKRISLPADINRQELIEHPKKYKQIIDAKKVNTEERDALIASGLFVRYWVEKKCTQ